MFDFLSKLQNKPEHHRRKILFLSTTLLTGFIALIWISSMYLSFVEQKDKAEGLADASSTSPIGAFVEVLANAKNAFKFPR